MRKLSLVAAGVSMAIAGSANAALVVNANMFMSGASAPSNMLREHVVQNVCSQAAPINVYVDVVRTIPGAGNPAAANPILEHTTHWVVSCTAAAGTGTNLAGKTIAVYKSDAGGSGNGTTPIPNEVPMQFMNADNTNCALTTAGQAHNGGGSYNLYTCGTDDIVSQIPDMGTSDIEPGKFVGSLAPSSGDFVDLGNLNIKAGPGLVFGVAITKAFRDELQADQGLTVGAEDEANMPSLPQAYVSSITQGRVWRWSDEEVYGQALNLPTLFAGLDGVVGTGGDDVSANSLTPYVHICRRVQGSGTHAQHMIEYHRTNCMSGSIPMPAGKVNPTGNLPVVFENSSSGNLGACLDRLDKGTGYASSNPAIPAGRASFGLGYQATEKNMGLQENWRYVKIDGHAPTLENAFNGDYDQVYYLSFQMRTADAPVVAGTATAGNGVVYETGAIRTTAADAGAIADFFNNNMNIAGNIVAAVNEGFVHSWGQAGFLQPSTTAPAAYNVNNPLTPWARETASAIPDSCQPLTRKR